MTESRKVIDVLLICENQADAQFFHNRLVKAKRVRFALQIVTSVDEALTLLKDERIDVVLLDLQMMSEDSLGPFRKIREEHRSLPIVVLSEEDNDEIGILAVREGAQDYLQRSEVDSRLLEHALRYAIDRKEAEHELRTTEARYRSLVESLPVNVFQKDLAGHLIFANKLYCETMNSTWEKLAGKNDYDLFPDELAEKYRRDDARVVESGDSLEDIEEHVRQDGEHIYVHVLKGLVRDADENIIGTQGMFWDVTAQKRAEEALKQSDARFRRFVNSDIIGIVNTDKNDNIIKANNEFLRMVGYTREELEEGKVTWEKITPEEHNHLEEELQIRLQETGECPPRELEYIRKDNSRIPALVGMTLLGDSEKEAIYFALDMTAQKKVEAELQAAKETADAANRAKSDFLANMSHEIRTPMNAVIGMTELVLDTEIGADQRDYLEMVLQSAESLLSIINDILDFSKIEAGKLELDPMPFQLYENLGDTMKSLAVRAGKNWLELITDIHHDVPKMVYGDGQRLRQILINLVGNAIKFTPQGEIVLTVKLVNETKEGFELEFAVSDTGIGISSSKLHHIFNAFEQADTSTTRQFGGTGLGLSISQRLVNLMGGEISVESEVDKGSTFSFNAWFGKLSEAEYPQSTDRDTVDLVGLRVLVVDDNQNNRRILNEMLLNWKMNPVVAPNVTQALQHIRQQQRAGTPFDLILSDVNMPDQDGFTLVELLHEDEELDSPVVMMLTSGDRPEDLGRCQELGIAAHLIKPLKQSELFDTVATVMGKLAPSVMIDRIPPDHHKPIVSNLDILLAEDSLANQKLAVGLLNKRGHQVTVVNNGHEAVEAVKAHDYDLILMDVQMPDMDGFEATAAIRDLEDGTPKHIPIVAMTAHAMKGDRERCLRFGMDAYLSKPIRAKQVYDTIEFLAATSQSLNSEIPLETGANVEEPEQPSLSTQEYLNQVSEKERSCLQAALEAVDFDEELLTDFVTAIVAESPNHVLQAREAFEKKDLDTLKRVAHTIRGTMRTLGMEETCELAAELEEKAKDNQLAGGELLLDQLNTNVTEISKILQDFLSKCAPQAD